MKIEQIDLRGQMRIFTQLLESESIETPADEDEALITRDARAIVEGVAVHMLYERTPKFRSSGVSSDDYLEQNHPDVINNLEGGMENEALSEFLQNLWDYLCDSLPNMSRSWSHHFQSDYLYYKPEEYVPVRKRPPVTLAEFERYLNELHRKEGEYIQDTVRLIEQFKCNRVN